MADAVDLRAASSVLVEVDAIDDAGVQLVHVDEVASV